MGEWRSAVGLFDRIFRRSRPEPSEPPPGLFTARSSTVPPELADARAPTEDAPPPPEDLWDRPARDVEQDVGQELRQDVESPAEEPVRVEEPAPAEPPEADAVVERIPEAEPAELEALGSFDPEPDEPADHVVHTVAPAADEPVEPLWDDATWESEAVADEIADAIAVGGPADEPTTAVADGSTAEDPLFPDPAETPAPPPAPQPEPLPPLFDPPAVAAEPDPTELVQTPTTDPTDSATTERPELIVSPPPAASDEPASPDDEARTMRVHDGRLDKRPGPIRMTPSEALALAQDGPRALRRRSNPEA